jgi:arylsulfatase A-like enzyme
MSKPFNIVFMMADQWRWDTIFDPGHVCQTPNLLRFSEGGVVFSNAYSPCPLCSPARGALFTGKWPHQTGLIDNVGGMMYYTQGKLHPDQVTYLERLRDDAGYAISYAGKWHMGTGTLPERGVGTVRGSDGGPPGNRRERHPRPVLDGDVLPPYYGSFSQGVGRDQYIVERGIEQIAELARGEGPFCAVISTWGPHFPHNVPRRFAELYESLPHDFQPDNYCPPFLEENKPLMQSRPYWPCQNTRPLSAEDWRRTCQHYWGFCTHVDEQFGRVIAALDELGIAEDTVVAFSVDHGEMLGGHGGFDKGPYLYQEIMHIPMIVRDPLGRPPQNADGFVNLRDLFPTLISLTGAEHVLNAEEETRSYWVTEHEHAFYTYDAYQGRQFKLRGIHAGRFKYNWSPPDLCELYDLQNDPGERVNLTDAPEYVEIQAELHDKLMAWMRAENDYLLCAEHLMPVGSYVDGRAFEEQHDHGWSQAEWNWFRCGGDA